MRSFQFLLLTSALFITGCVSAPPYVPPSTGPTAQLRFSQDHVRVLFYPDASCLKPQELGAERTIRVTAEKRIFMTMTFFSPAGRGSCTAKVSFVPAMDKSYVVEYFEPDGDHCSASIERTDLGGKKLGQEPSKEGFNC